MKSGMKSIKRQAMICRDLGTNNTVTGDMGLRGENVAKHEFGIMQSVPEKGKRVLTQLTVLQNLSNLKR